MAKDLTYPEYQAEVVLADEERAVLAGHLALKEVGPWPEDERDFLRWRKIVNKKAAEIFARLN